MAGKTFSEFTEKTLSEIKSDNGYIVGVSDDENIKVAVEEIANSDDIPTKTSELTNDGDGSSVFMTKTYVDGLVGDIESQLAAI